jgi:hypothetical protein
MLVFADKIGSWHRLSWYYCAHFCWKTSQIAAPLTVYRYSVQLSTVFKITEVNFFFVLLKISYWNVNGLYAPK